MCKLVEKGNYVYQVKNAEQTLERRGDWDKNPFNEIEPVQLNKIMGKKPAFFPETQVKMCYNMQSIIIMFRVEDKYVRSQVSEINGPVFEDSCVEFFFSPNMSQHLEYFNLEINAGGIPLMHYNIKPREKIVKLNVEDIRKIKISSSLSSMIEEEITHPLIWYIECRIPIEMLSKYTNVTYPERGVSWRANFYKTAKNTSNPHFITWSEIESEVPDFHIPSCFGTIIFN